MYTVLIAVVSKVILLVSLSNFEKCALPCACTLEPHSTDSLGTQHRAIFHALIITTPSIQARCVHIIIGDIFNILNTFLLIL